jgi:PAS domain S-box-containing protein/diguanylate cyclase (GGDEF)-like protein
MKSMNTAKWRSDFFESWTSANGLWDRLRSGEALQRLRQHICESMLRLSAWLSLPLLVLSLARVWVWGWQPMLMVHAGMATVIWTVFALRRRMPLWLTAGVQVAIYLLVGWVGYWSFGLGSGATSWLALSGLVAALLLGMRTGLAVWGVALLGSLLLGALNIHWGRQPLLMTEDYLFSFHAWLLSVAAWAIPAFLVLWALVLFGQSAATIIHEAARLTLQLTASEKRFRTVIASAPNVGIVTTDKAGKIVVWSDGAAQMFGRPPDEMIGGTLESIVPAKYRAAHHQGMSEATYSGGLKAANAMHQVVGLRANGKEFPLELSLGSWTEGDEMYFIAVMLDITERLSARENIELLGFAMEKSPLGMAIFDGNGQVLYCNGSYRSERGLSAADLATHNAFQVDAKSSSAQLAQEITRATQAGGIWRKERMHRGVDGRVKWEHLSVSLVNADEGEGTRYILLSEDVTQSRTDQDRLFQLANYCELTELPNKKHLESQVEQGLSEHNGYILLLIDLAGIKFINESLGFAAGDALILEASRRLKRLKKFHATLSHLGGGQFVLAGSSLSIEQAEKLCEQIVEAFQKPFDIHHEKIYQAVSIGIATAPEDGESVGELLSHAYTAKGVARSLGDNRWSYFSSQLNLEAQERLHLDALLRQALDGSEFVLHYQPKVDQHRRFRGVEALLRWHSAELGWVLPGKFIDHMERSELILGVGEWVLREGCRYAATLQSMGLGHVTVAINVSPKQFLDDHFVQTVRDAIHLAGVPPAMIELEITESVFIGDDQGRVDAQVRRLQNIGVGLVLDDFGTGYASLGYLRNIPFNVIKIDRTFIQELFHQSENAILLKAMIDMVHALGMVVVAEGVEDGHQAQFLVEHRCDLMQGYLFAKPMGQDELWQWLQSQEDRTVDPVCEAAGPRGS